MLAGGATVGGAGAPHRPGAGAGGRRPGRGRRGPGGHAPAGGRAPGRDRPRAAPVVAGPAPRRRGPRLFRPASASFRLRTAWTPSSCGRPSPSSSSSAGHMLVPSAGLIPHHPAAPLLTNAGMNQFIPVMIGEEPPPYRPGRSPSRSASAPRTSRSSATPPATSRSSRCWATSASATTSRRQAIPLAWELVTERPRPRPRAAVGHRAPRRRRGRGHLAGLGGRARRPHPAHGRRQLLGDGQGQARPVRPLLGDLLRQGRGVRRPRRAAPRRRRALRRDLEPGLHAVPAPARRVPRRPAHPQHRHRGRARAHPAHPPGRDDGVRHRRGPPRPRRRRTGHRPHLRVAIPRSTGACASWPTTAGP